MSGAKELAFYELLDGLHDHLHFGQPLGERDRLLLDSVVTEARAKDNLFLGVYKKLMSARLTRLTRGIGYLTDYLADPAFLQSTMVSNPRLGLRILRELRELEKASLEFIRGSLSEEAGKKGFPKELQQTYQQLFVMVQEQGADLDDAHSVTRLFERLESLARQGGELPQPPERETVQARARLIERVLECDDGILRATEGPGPGAGPALGAD
jgi:hypothetical protein